MNTIFFESLTKILFFRFTFPYTQKPVLGYIHGTFFFEKIKYCIFKKHFSFFFVKSIDNKFYKSLYE